MVDRYQSHVKAGAESHCSSVLRVFKCLRGKPRTDLHLKFRPTLVQVDRNLITEVAARVISPQSASFWCARIGVWRDDPAKESISGEPVVSGMVEVS